MWWLRYFWLRLMFILTLVNIMTCVGAWYAVSSSYGDRKHHGRHGVPYSFIEISRNFDLLDSALQFHQTNLLDVTVLFKRGNLKGDRKQ